MNRRRPGVQAEPASSSESDGNLVYPMEVLTESWWADVRRHPAVC
jgi:hypothetical protein